MRIGRTAFAVVAASALLAGCGYRVAGRSDGLPKSIHVIAVPALENKTTSYRIEQRLTAVKPASSSRRSGRRGAISGAGAVPADRSTSGTAAE